MKPDQSNLTTIVDKIMTRGNGISILNAIFHFIGVPGPDSLKLLLGFLTDSNMKTLAQNCLQLSIKDMDVSVLTDFIKELPKGAEFDNKPLTQWLGFNILDISQERFTKELPVPEKGSEMAAYKTKVSELLTFLGTVNNPNLLVNATKALGKHLANTSSISPTSSTTPTLSTAITSAIFAPASTSSSSSSSSSSVLTSTSSSILSSSSPSVPTSSPIITASPSSTTPVVNLAAIPQAFFSENGTAITAIKVVELGEKLCSAVNGAKRNTTGEKLKDSTSCQKALATELMKKGCFTLPELLYIEHMLICKESQLAEKNSLLRNSTVARIVLKDCLLSTLGKDLALKFRGTFDSVKNFVDIKVAIDWQVKDASSNGTLPLDEIKKIEAFLTAWIAQLAQNDKDKPLYSNVIPSDFQKAVIDHIFTDYFDYASPTTQYKYQ